MIKLIFSDQLPKDLNAGMTLIEDPDKFVKKASLAFDLTSENLRPPKGYVGIHTVALGDWEHYGMNRNGDAFTKESCQKYHHTFVKHGHVFRNHDNKDPVNAIGKIAASAYNEPMGRIELVIWADEKKAAPELHKLAETGESSFSMACRIPEDECTVCHARRKNSADPRMCDHVRYELGKIAADGTAIGTFNPEPTWFDESFVHRPADRIAWDLGKVASFGTGGEPSSEEYAKLAGVYVPDSVYEDSVPGFARRARLFRKLASFEQAYFKCTAQGIKTASDSSYMNLAKAASTDIAPGVLDRIRALPCDGFLKYAADAGIVFSAPVFFKYAFGRDFGKAASYMPDVVNIVKNGLFTQLEKRGMFRDVCSDAYFDADAATLQVPHDLDVMLKRAFSVHPEHASARAVDHVASGYPLGSIAVVEFKTAESGEAVKLASAYASYVLSAVGRAIDADSSAETPILALSGSQNLLL
jgi:hypothetical protein